MPTLLWFRRDLRLHDLPALLDAAKDDQEVLACYVLDPRLKKSGGPRRLQYLYDSLRELRDGLDGRLLIVEGKPEERIPALAKKTKATSVHVSGEMYRLSTKTSAASQFCGSRGSQSPRSSSRIRLPDGASRAAREPPPAPVPMMMTS